MIRYPGSKAKLSRKVLRQFPSDVSGLSYYEPFCGASYTFRRVIRNGLPFRSFHLSDLSEWTVNYLKALRDPNHDSRGDLIDRLDVLRDRLTPELEHEDEIRAEYERMKPLARDLDPLAYLFLATYANGQFCMGARKDVASFHPKFLAGGVSTLTRVKAEGWRGVLQRASVERLNALELLPSLGSDCFVYLDPPYPNHKANGKPKFRMYHFDFCEADHRRLAEILRKAKFRFCLSYSDKPIVRELYEGFEFRWLHRVVKHTRTKFPSYGEWLIKNF